MYKHTHTLVVALLRHTGLLHNYQWQTVLNLFSWM